jgi:DNA modification methylase
MIIHGDCTRALHGLPDQMFQTCVTSPPYWGLRDYGVDGQLGLEKTPDEYVEKIVRVFQDVRRVLKDDGTVWLNLGDSYAASGGEAGGGNREMLHMDGKQKRMRHVPAGTGLKLKDLVGMPWRVAFALQADGWYLRQDIIWHKTNPMPESVRDRCTKSHEYIFLLSKSKKYYFDHVAIREPAVYPEGPRNKGPHHKVHPESGREVLRTRENVHSIGPRATRNKRSVWTVSTKPFKGAHFATFPPDLIEPCILAGSAFGDYVLDPFAGAGTTGLVAKRHGRKFVGIELNESYVEIAEKRIEGVK